MCNKPESVADTREGLRGPVPPFLEGFLFTKAKFTSKKLVLNNYEICL